MSNKKEIPKGLKVFTVEQLKEGISYQREKYGWDLNNEREFIEDLFCQRFNFLLVIYSLFITASASAKSQSIFMVVLALGAILTLLVSLTIWRAYIKLIVNLKILHNMPKHAFYFIQNETNKIGARSLFGVNSIIGLWVPVFCTLSLTTGAVLAYIGILKVT